MIVRLLLLLLSIIIIVLSRPHERVKRWDKYENLSFSFDCSDKPVGFYADQEYNCNIFHMCDEKGTRIPHACANGTSFNQEYRICDWEYNFNCSEAHKWYYLNSLTYATENQADDDDDDEEFLER